MKNGVSIVYLGSRREWLRVVAEWHCREWSFLRPGEGLESWAKKLSGVAGCGGIPSIFVAAKNDLPIGSAMLVRRSMTTHEHLSPWIGGIYVLPEFRRKGVGQSLVESALAEARTIGASRVYLYTPSAEHFYEKTGWVTLERPVYRGVTVALMSYELQEAEQSGSQER